MRVLIIALGLVATVSAHANPSASVAQILEKEARAQARGALAPVCNLLDSHSTADRERYRQMIARKDANALWAAGDSFLFGRNGAAQSIESAMSLYGQAMRAGSKDAAFNLGLLYYRHALQTNERSSYSRALGVFDQAGLLDENAKGELIAVAHFIAGDVFDRALLGERDLRRAFMHFRVAARNQHVPSVHRYLRLLSSDLSAMSEAQRREAVQEIRTMGNRWRWQSAEIMALLGDMYAAGHFTGGDAEFQSKYHWQLASGMFSRAGGSPTALHGRSISYTDPAQQSRLDRAVEAAFRTYRIELADSGLRFRERCPL